MSIYRTKETRLNSRSSHVFREDISPSLLMEQYNQLLSLARYVGRYVGVYVGRT